jgi:hypothetical protein
VALTQEVTKTHISILDLELLHNYLDLSPSRSVDDAVPSFVDLGFKLDLLPCYLGIGAEFTELSHSTYLEFGGRLNLAMLLTSGLVLFKQSHVDCFEKLVIIEEFLVL